MRDYHEAKKAALDGRSAPPGWPAAVSGRLLFIVFATGARQRRALGAWIDGARPPDADQPAAVQAGKPDRLAAALEAAPADLVVVPLGVARLTKGIPRGPWPALRRGLRRRGPEPYTIIVGEPAQVSELRQRWLRDGWSEAGRWGFANFVRRQGLLALERAERELVGSRYKVPSQVREEIRRSKSFWAGIASLSEASGRRDSEVAEEALGYLDEMMARLSRLGVDAFARFERWLLRSYRVEFDPGRLDGLRELNRRRPLVFLPSHRSYLDPIVLGLILHDGGFPPNHRLGGINLDFWPLGPLVRRAGVVFIRRSIRDNDIYKFALRHYLGYLVEKRFNLEWYLEGGRSRTGKLRPPRFGLFAYLVEAFRQGRAHDIALVPVSIVYDQLYEVAGMTREAHGAAKQKENVRFLIGYTRAQGRRFGAVHVRFGEPLSLREALQAADSKLAVEKVALEVCNRINAVTPITPNSLVTMALLGVADRALTLSEIRDTLQPLLDYVKVRRLPVTEPALLKDEAGLLRTLKALEASGVVEAFREGLEPVYAIGPDQHLVAAFYRNGAIHFFVNRAVGELALARLTEGESSDPLAEAWEESLRLRDLLKFEFFFPRRAEYADQLRHELEILSSGGTIPDAQSALAGSRLHLAHRVLGSFMEAYWVVADRLASRGSDAPIDESAFMVECLATGRQYLAQRRIHSPESVSKELFGNALRLAANRGLTTAGRDDLAKRRRAFAAELSTILRRLEAIRELALGDLKPGERS